MRATTRVLAAATAAALLTPIGAATAHAGEMRRAAELPTEVSSRAALPTGNTYRVTASGDAGAGTFGEAVGLANASPGPDTIEFASGLDVTLTGVWSLDESVTIRGEGATVHWSPGGSGTAPWLSGDGVNAQLFDLTISLESEAQSPMVSFANAPAEYPIVFDGVTLLDPLSGGALIEEAAGGVDLRGVTASGPQQTATPGNTPVIQVLGAGKHVSIADSEFSDLSNPAVHLARIDLQGDGQVAVRGTKFSNIAPGGSLVNGAAFRAESVYGGTGAAPALLVNDTDFTGVGGRARSVVHVASVEGGVALENSSVTDTQVDSASINLASLTGGVGAENVALRVADVRFANNEGRSHVFKADEVRGSVMLANTSVRDSRVGMSAVAFSDVAEQIAGTPVTITAADSEIANVAGISARPPRSGLSVEGATANLLLERDTFSGVSALMAAVTTSGSTGAVHVNDSEFVSNSSTGLAVLTHTLPDEGQVRVLRSEFVKNVFPTTGGFGGVVANANRSGTHTSPLVEVRDSVFLENAGGLSGGVSVNGTRFQQDSATNLLVEGSTFWNPSTGAQGIPDSASDIRFAAFQDAGSGPANVVVRNSTVERRDAEYPETPALFVGAATVLEHVSMPGGFVAHQSGTGSLELRNSVLGADTDPAVQVAGSTPITGAGNTMPVLGDVPAGAADVLPLSEWQLGELADNGGATPTLMPEETSPLVDTAVASDVAGDQRGVARPQGPKPDRGAVELAVTPPGALQINADDAQLSVVAGDPAQIRVERAEPADEPAKVFLELRDGTAVGGTDYEQHRYELTWAPGETTAQVAEIPTYTRGEAGTRVFTAGLVDVSGAQIGLRDAATVTIIEKVSGGGPGEGGGNPGTGGEEPDPVPGTGPATGGPTNPLAGTGADAVWPIGLAVVAVLLGLGSVMVAARVRRKSKGPDNK